jgi:acyl carrier protein
VRRATANPPTAERALFSGPNALTSADRASAGYAARGGGAESRESRRAVRPLGPIKRRRIGAPRQGAACASIVAEAAKKPETEGLVTDNVQDKSQLVDEIIEVIAAEGMVDRSKITPDASIESLDLKSVDIVMILTALEEKFNVYIPMDGSLQEAKDVKSLIEAIADHIQKEREKQ